MPPNGFDGRMNTAEPSGKWWLDTTSCCRSANNSGIQRVVRGLYHHLSPTLPVHPLVWDEFSGGFSSPTAGEYQYLTTPFEKTADKVFANPNRQSLSFGRFLRKRFAHRIHRIDLTEEAPENLLLLPEVFRDSRILYLPRPAEIPYPVVAWFHDACALQLGPLVPSAKTRRFERYLKYLAECDQIITISEYSQQVFLDWCQKEHLPAPPIAALPLPVEFPAARITHVAESNNPRIQVLFVSSLTYNKNHSGLFDACRTLWDQGERFDLVLVGKVDAAWKTTILPLLDDLRQRGYPLQWKQHIDDQALQSAYKDCHFTVYPSLCEGYGLPILESLWFAKPCLLPDSGAMREVATAGGCHFFSLDQPESLVNGLRQLIHSPSLRRKLAEEASASTFPQWSEYRNQLVPILRQVRKIR